MRSIVPIPRREIHPQHDTDTLSLGARMAEYLWSNMVPGGRYTKVGPSFAVEKVTSSEKITFFSNSDHHFLPQRQNALLYAPPYELP